MGGGNIQMDVVKKKFRFFLVPRRFSHRPPMAPLEIDK